MTISSSFWKQLTVLIRKSKLILLNFYDAPSSHVATCAMLKHRVIHTDRSCRLVELNARLEFYQRDVVRWCASVTRVQRMRPEHLYAMTFLRRLLRFRCEIVRPYHHGDKALFFWFAKPIISRWHTHGCIVTRNRLASVSLLQCAGQKVTYFCHFISNRLEFWREIVEIAHIYYLFV